MTVSRTAKRCVRQEHLIFVKMMMIQDHVKEFPAVASEVPPTPCIWNGRGIANKGDGRLLWSRGFEKATTDRKRALLAISERMLFHADLPTC